MMYKLLIKMKNGEKIETVVSKSIINYLHFTHENYKNYGNINCLIDIEGREIKVEVSCVLQKMMFKRLKEDNDGDRDRK